MATSTAEHGHGIETYRGRRDFSVTAEPPPRPAKAAGRAPIFVVQEHAARRLHWDFRLEHNGVLWSWAVPKGPSMDPADKRLAVHVEDHPLDYADFEGRIPQGQYGAGSVAIWDRGTWEPVGDPAAGLCDGELKFRLRGERLRGGFVLVRLKPRAKERGENWLLIKEHDTPDMVEAADPPARADAMPRTQSPQLATPVDTPPEDGGWISEVKFDGYRLLVRIENGTVRLITRNGHDWTDRLPTIAAAFAGLKVQTALLDAELVALRDDGISSFPDLQAALSKGQDDTLFCYAFDLLYLNGKDLRPRALRDRKQALEGLAEWGGRLRYSDHVEGQSGTMRRRACELGLEGIVCKRADAPYRAGRGPDWVKLKCQGREEFIVLGWTKPGGSRTAIGALQLGFRDPARRLHFAGGVGSGFTELDLKTLHARLEALAAPPPAGLLYGEAPPEPGVIWVKPDLVAEVQYAGWSGGGRLRHAVFLGLREDKTAREVVRDLPDPAQPRREFRVAAPRIVHAVPPRASHGGKERRMHPPATDAASERVVLEGVELTHATKELWPGITKRDLASYWLAVAAHALPDIAGRPLALVRCPDGIGGQHFFQKHAQAGFPPEIRAGEADGAPYLAIDDVAGLVAAVQTATLELHAWGASGDDPLHPDRLVFDLDPGEGVGMTELIGAAKEVRQRLEAAGLTGFVRSSGGKGLHVVAPLIPRAGWQETRDWCHGFARAMEADSPDRYVASVPKKRRLGRILVDWLRNGLGATSVASFSPRARPGAGVATPLAWRELTTAFDASRFTLLTVPDRLKRQKHDPWDGFAAAAVTLPERR